MKVKYKFLIFSFYVLELVGQNLNSKLFLMQGIWKNIMNNDTEKAYTIIRGMNSLSFVYKNNSNELDFPLAESIEGFQNFDSGENNEINIDSIKEDGQFYTVIDKKYIDKKGWVKRPNYLTPSYFECDGTSMSICGGQLVEYIKIDNLPYEALTKLYYRGKIDNRDYIKEYLNIKVTEIKKEKCILFNEKKNKTGEELTKGDVVIILEEKEKWLKIEYDENYKQGWIRKEDVLLK